MKKILSLALISAFIFAVSGYAYVNEKQIEKDAKKEAKKLEKEGFKPAPGALPLQRQLENSYAKQYDLDDDGMPKYYMGNASSQGTNYDAAKMQAGALARQDLATQIGSELTQLIDNRLANKQLEEGVVASLAQTTSKSKELISAKLSNTGNLLECYRKTSDGRYEVQVRIAYSKERALKQARAALRAQLEKESAELATTFDGLWEEE